MGGGPGVGSQRPSTILWVPIQNRAAAYDDGVPTLRNGQCTRDQRLDRIRQVDLRALNYPISDLLTINMYRAPRSYTWRLPIEVLNQGSEGSCVGHGFAHELAARPVMVEGITHKFAVDFYYGAQQRDPWAGGAYPSATPWYEGTSVQAGADEAKARGYCDEYRWVLSIPDLITTLGYWGPVVAGLEWTDDMFAPDNEGFIRPTGDVAGGHCVCFTGVKIERDAANVVDPVRSYVTGVNSWGPNYGIRGRFKMALVDLAVSWPTAEFVVLVRRRHGTPIAAA